MTLPALPVPLPMLDGSTAATYGLGIAALGCLLFVAALAVWSAGDGQRQCGALTQAIWLAPYRAWIADAAGR